MSFYELVTLGVWEATGAVATVEFRGPFTFFCTSFLFENLHSLIEKFAIFYIYEELAAEPSLVYRAGVCGKAVGVAA